MVELNKPHQADFLIRPLELELEVADDPNQPGQLMSTLIANTPKALRWIKEHLEKEQQRGELTPPHAKAVLHTAAVAFFHSDLEAVKIRLQESKLTYTEE